MKIAILGAVIALAGVSPAAAAPKACDYIGLEHPNVAYNIASSRGLMSCPGANRVGYTIKIFRNGSVWAMKSGITTAYGTPTSGRSCSSARLGRFYATMHVETRIRGVLKTRDIRTSTVRINCA